MKYRLSISTCPNDTFMFDAAIHRRIDTEGIEFDLKLCDIEELNRDALHGVAHVSKLSYALVPEILPRYKVLNSGSALGHGNGPLLVSRQKIYPDELGDAKVAIPGRHTTANLLLDRLFTPVRSKHEYLFSDIAEAVMSNECDAGVLIHEGRFLYKNIGLQLIADLGVEWERVTSLPLPLGAIVVSREIPVEQQQAIDRVICRSVEYALANPAVSAPFVKQYAREMDDNVIKSHIELFVNNYSIDLGTEGRSAVGRLLEIETDDIFV